MMCPAKLKKNQHWLGVGVLLMIIGAVLFLGPGEAQAINQLLNSVGEGKVIYFGGRRFVTMPKTIASGSVGGMTPADVNATYVWQAYDEQIQPWHAYPASSGFNNTASDFYSNNIKLGYWFDNSYALRLNASQPGATDWLINASFNMTACVDETCSTTGTITTLTSQKFSVPSVNEWNSYNSIYCNAIFGTACGPNNLLPFVSWTRNPNTSASSTTNVWYVDFEGVIKSTYSGYQSTVRPVLNLASGIYVCGEGDGSYENPYFLGMNGCNTTNQPLKPLENTLESARGGSVVSFGGYKWVKMSDYISPQQVTTTWGTTSNTYLVMADAIQNAGADYTMQWDPDKTSGCAGDSYSNVCGLDGGWTDIANTNNIKAYLNNSFLVTIPTAEQAWVIDTSWPVGGQGRYGSESDELVRADISKIALVSTREWLMWGNTFCKSYKDKSAKGCNGSDFTSVWWTRTPHTGYSGVAWQINTLGRLGDNWTDSYYAVRPALNLKSGLYVVSGEGTMTSPYELSEGGVGNLGVSGANWDMGAAELMVTGTVDRTVVDESITVWAEACNTSSECVRKEMVFASGETGALNYSLTWNASELPTGAYAGTIWVHASTDEITISTQSEAMTFTVGETSEGEGILPNSVVNLSQGAVVQISPKEGTYMCNASTCTADSATPAEPYKLMHTGTKDEDSAYFVMLDNYCAWRSADCTYVYNTTLTKLWYASSWNSKHGSAAYSNNIGGNRYDYNFLNQLDNFYGTLPDELNKLTKSDYVLAKSFDMVPVNQSSGTGTSTYATCKTSANSIPFGNIGATFDDTTCAMTSKISLLSYDEWQGKSGDLPWSYGHFPSEGTIGNAFCLTRFGEPCSSTVVSSGMVNNTAYKNPRSPWTRTASGNNTSNVWFISPAVASNMSMYYETAATGYGILPSLWLSSATCVTNTEGTYEKPASLYACAAERIDLSLSSDFVEWNDTEEKLTVSGQVAGVTDLARDITVWAAVCNSDNECVKKEMLFNSGTEGAVQDYTLTWDASELINGFYEGTIWVNAYTELITATAESVSTTSQTDPVSFLIGHEGAPDRSLAKLSLGTVIQISPKEGTYMCNALACTADSATPAEPYKLMITGEVSDNGTLDPGDDGVYAVMLDNYCAWRSADCTYTYNTTNTKYWYGTSWNSQSGSTSYSSNLGGSRKSQNILIQLDNFYNTLPDELNKLTKSDYVLAKSFDMVPVNQSSGTGTSTYATCKTSANSIPFGNIGATFDDTTCAMTSKISLLSYDEWQGKSGDLPWSYGHFPSEGTIGSELCRVRYGTADCSNNSNYDLFTGDGIKDPYSSWTRTPQNSSYVWAVSPSSSTNSMLSAYAYKAFGVQPSLWLSTDLCALDGEGIYSNPSRVVSCAAADVNLVLSPSVSTWEDSDEELTITGQVIGESKINQKITVWASACNVEGVCAQKEVELDSGVVGAAQDYSLNWKKDELPAGNYDGAIWVNAYVGNETAAVQTNAVQFEIEGNATGENKIMVILADTEWDDVENSLTIAGTTALTTDTDTEITISADVCNTDGQCIRKQTTVDSGVAGEAKPFSLTWTLSNLPAGTYSGAVWVQATAGDERGGAQSSTVTFTIGARELDLTVPAGQNFSLKLGNASYFNLPAVTQDGITVRIDAETNKVYVEGALSQNKQVTLGNTILNFSVMAVPQIQVQNVDLR